MSDPLTSTTSRSLQTGHPELVVQYGDSDQDARDDGLDAKPSGHPDDLMPAYLRKAAAARSFLYLSSVTSDPRQPKVASESAMATQKLSPGRPTIPSDPSVGMPGL
ncbi:uncharacterized protein B0T23DRAFT_425977 [Neurospora hispaniola]|uniref:Uncharacterized protein n=1 Tax=Neurospora hispaniola TaxID=588809 RepID=A0AAJ0MTA1_9PEZI|nr:hypothetical protein B0T23DRAFT_425977 [Neurospora hispaniola]